MKTTMKTGLATLVLLLTFSCKKELLNGSTSAISQTQDEVSIKTEGHYIGERFGGGVIFWIDSTGLHGLIADTVDLGNFAWWNGIYTVTGAKATRIGSGKTNTRKIVVSQGKTGYYAALQCAKSKNSGYTDWLLPSKDELNEIYKQKAVIGGSFFLAGYWSSSESNNNQASGQRFDDGYQYTDGDKHYGSNVRAIRIF